MRVVLLSLCLLASLASSCIAFQQDTGTLWLELLSSRPVRFSHGLDLSGRLDFRQYPGDRETNYAVSEFYLHPVIFDELKLAPDKRSELENAFEQIQNDWSEKLRQLSQVSDSKERRAELAKLEDHQRTITTKLVERIGSALSRSQENRLRQLQLRFLIHQNGFYQTFNNSSIQKLLGTPPLDAEQFKKSQHEIAKTIRRKNRAFANQAFDDWLSDLSVDHRKVFGDRWGGILRQSTGTQQLIIQLNSELKPTEFDPGNRFDLSQNWPEWMHDSAGCCVLKKKSERTVKRTPLAKLNRLHSFVVSQHFQRDIELVDEQIASFKELSAQFYQQKMVINTEIGKKYDIEPLVLGHTTPDGHREVRVVYTLKTTEQLEEFERAIAPIADEYYEKHLDVLLPHQLELLEAIVGNMNTRLQGPLAELLWGDVGKVLELTDDDKESLKAKADVSRKMLETESKKIYDEAIEQLIELVPRKDRQKFRRCLGDEFKALYPNLDGFSMALASQPVTNEDEGNK